MADPFNEPMDFDKEQDVPPDVPVPAGFYEGVVAGVQLVTQGPEDKPYPGKMIARITYRLKHETEELDDKRVSPFPVPVRDDPDSWRWFKWLETMGYKTDKPFRFDPTDVEGITVSLKFGPPRTGKGENAGKLYTNLESVQRIG